MLKEEAERLTANVRAKVEHPFHVVKNLFRYYKAREWGHARNKAKLFTLLGLAKLVIPKRPLLDTWDRGGLEFPQGAQSGYAIGLEVQRCVV